MKKYRHKITGDWVEKSNDEYYRLQTDGRTFPKRFIEDSVDWEIVESRENEYEKLSRLALPPTWKISTDRQMFWKHGWCEGYKVNEGKVNEARELLKKLHDGLLADYFCYPTMKEIRDFLDRF